LANQLKKRYWYSTLVLVGSITFIRPCPMRVLRVSFNMWTSCNGLLSCVELWHGWERRWTHSTWLKPAGIATRRCFFGWKLERVAHAQTTSVKLQTHERESSDWISGDKWHAVIGCLGFFILIIWTQLFHSKLIFFKFFFYQHYKKTLDFLGKNSSENTPFSS